MSQSLANIEEAKAGGRREGSEKIVILKCGYLVCAVGDLVKPLKITISSMSLLYTYDSMDK